MRKNKLRNDIEFKLGNADKRVKKFVKLIDHVYAYNSLTNFEYEGNEMTENGYYLNLLCT